MAENGDRPINDLAPLIDQMREIIAKSRKLLESPVPDTFLGRKTQTPFPKEEG